MYAVINTGGKQYKLTEGDLLEVERLEGEVGDEVIFDEVLLLGDSDAPVFGSPQVEGAQVVGTIVEQKKGDKIVVFKYKRRKMYRRKAGHRQLLTKVKIDSILDGSSKAKKGAEKKEKAPSEIIDDSAAKKKAKAEPKTAKKPKKAKPKKTARKTKETKAGVGAKAEAKTDESSKSKSSSQTADSEKDDK